MSLNLSLLEVDKASLNIFLLAILTIAEFNANIFIILCELNSVAIKHKY